MHPRNLARVSASMELDEGSDQKSAPLDGCACVFKEWLYGVQKVPSWHGSFYVLLLFSFCRYILPCHNLKVSHMSHLMTKPTKLPLCPGKTQISLGIRPIWSESSLSAWRNPRYFSYPLSAQRRLIRLILVFAGRKGHFVGFVMMRLNYDKHINVHGSPWFSVIA